MSERETSVVFFGDVFLPEPVQATGLFDGPYACNFESPITRCNAPVPGKILLQVSQDHLAETFGRLPLAVCVANNHILDYGVEGLLNTLEHMDAHGIVAFGAGSAAVRHRNPGVIEVGGRHLGLLGYVCPTTHPADLQGATGDWLSLMVEDSIAADIARCRDLGLDRIVVNFHWGEEHVGLPHPKDVALAHRVINAGADLLIGHHSHCIQGHEVHAGRHIFYGLGNTIFPDFDVRIAQPDGTVSRVERGIWRRRNRTSLAVHYDPASNQCRAEVLQLKGQRLVRVGQGAERYRINPHGAQYPRRFEKAVVWGKFRCALGRFWARPKLPSADHFRSLLSWARQGIRGQS